MKFTHQMNAIMTGRAVQEFQVLARPLGHVIGEHGVEGGAKGAVMAFAPGLRGPAEGAFRADMDAVGRKSRDQAGQPAGGA